MLKSFLKSIFNENQQQAAFQAVDGIESNLGINDIKAIASNFAKKENWEHLAAKNIILKKETTTGHLFWEVDFVMKEIDDDLYQGTRGFLRISDESGHIVHKSYVPY